MSDKEERDSEPQGATHTTAARLRPHLFDAQAFLVHITQVKHGLGTVLLL